MDFGVILLILAFIVYPVWSVYDDSKEKPLDGQALFFAVAVVAFLAFWIIFFTGITR